MVAMAQRPVEPERAGRDVELKAGDRVRHPKFGEGIVIKSTPKAGDIEVQVAFKGEAGMKRLLQSFASLVRM